ncbi:MAG: hypothetical protein PF495_16675 [Spirochaetales bacterium]|nr:hypothetical protein [Spirochaetales bacterium]
MTIVLLFLAVGLNAQYVSTLRVTNETTAFGTAISQGMQIFNTYNNELYVAEYAFSSGATLTTAADSVKLIVDYDRLTDNYLSMFQGVRWNKNDDTYQRTGSLIDIAVSQSAGNANLPVHSQMKRCVLDDYGIVQYYVDADNPTYQDGSTTLTVDYTGGDGQVMVQTQKFYYRVEFTVQGDYYWSVSLYHLPGFTLHPAFFKDGQEVNYRYFSAFEGSMYDASAGAMTASGSITTSLYSTGDIMCSVSNQWAKTNEQRSEYRSMAAQRGEGWRQLDWTLNSAVQLLFLVEYANFNTQSMIGNGRTDLSGGSWTADSYIGKTGLSISDGNGTNSVSNGGTSGYLTDYMTYRGIENWYGNVWKMFDGITWDGRWTGTAAAQPVYYTNNSEYFKDTGSDNMRFLTDASYIGTSAGYITDFENTFVFIPSAVGGSSLVYDYYYQYSESSRDYWRVPLVGGSATHGGQAGGFALGAYAAWSLGNSSFGARLCF